jgi:hypothetical protein
MRKLNHGAMILVLLLLATVAPAQAGKPIRIDENSDWWSVIRENDSDEDLKPQDLDIDASNFRVLGITVGSDDLEAVQKKLGPAHVVNAGRRVHRPLPNLLCRSRWTNLCGLRGR